MFLELQLSRTDLQNHEEQRLIQVQSIDIHQHMSCNQVFAIAVGNATQWLSV